MPYVVDTHALVWHLAGDPKLSPAARTILESVDNDEDHIIEKARKIPRHVVPDPWDRLIGATSRHLNIPLISRDTSLTGIGLEIVW